MTARLSAPVTMVFCVTPFARGNVAPMLHEKELSLPRPTLEASQGRLQRGAAMGRILIIVIVISRLLLA